MHYVCKGRKSVFLTFTASHGRALSKTNCTLTGEICNTIRTCTIDTTWVIDAIIIICVRQGDKHYMHTFTNCFGAMCGWWDLTITLKSTEPSCILTCIAMMCTTRGMHASLGQRSTGFFDHSKAVTCCLVTLSHALLWPYNGENVWHYRCPCNAESVHRLYYHVLYVML